jgi:Mrr N-terminal domain
MPDDVLPSVAGLRPLVLAALRDAGGTSTTASLRGRVERLGDFSAAQLSRRHGPGPGSELHYRLRWALVDLRRRGVVHRSAPRTWSLSEDPASRPGTEQLVAGTGDPPREPYAS